MIVEMSLNVGELKGRIMEACLEDEFFRNERRSFEDTFVVDGTWLLVYLKMQANMS